MQIYPSKVECNEKPLFVIEMLPSKTVDSGVACFFTDRIECDYTFKGTNVFAMFRKSHVMHFIEDTTSEIIVVCLDRFSIELNSNKETVNQVREQIVTWMRS